MKKPGKGVRSLGIVAIAGVLLLAGCAKKSTANAGSGGSTGSSGSSASVTVSTKSISGMGTVLVDPNGMTLYTLQGETAGNIMCTGTCATNWPPLLLPSGVTSATAGTGVNGSKLGTASRPDGGTQVTYGGKPLYLFISDKNPGQATGQGVAGFSVATASSSGGSASGASGSSGGGYHY